MNIWLWPCLLISLVFATEGLSANAAEGVCAKAALQAAQSSDVPYSVLLAVSLAESGRTGTQNAVSGVVAWPWSVNTGGESHWFENRDSAIQLVADRLSRGQRNIDIGCFQLNIRWHSTAFSSLEAMFDPEQNAQYAAHFLHDLFAESGDWRTAVGAYHSRNPDRAEAYVTRLKSVFQAQTKSTPPERATPSETNAARRMTGATAPLILMTGMARPLLGSSQP